MKDLKIELEKWRCFLTEKLKEIDSVIEKSPEGIIHCERRGADVRYFLFDPVRDMSGDRGVYIRKEDQELAQKIAQKKYCMDLKKEVERQLRAFDRLIRIFERRDLERFYAEANAYRKRLITPVFLPAEDIVLKWFGKYQTLKHQDGELEYRTVNGKMVKTKSERSIADELTRHGIPFKYECCLSFGEEEYPLYPPFTVINLRTGEEYYWEHIEFIENRGFSDTFMWRLEQYERHGLWPGEKVILTYETPYRPFSHDMIVHYIETYLR